MPKLTKGAKNAVKCLAIKKSDRVVIITDFETRHIAKVVREEIKKIGAEVLWIEIEEEIGKRPAKTFPKTFQDKLLDFKPNASYYIASVKKRRTTQVSWSVN